MSLYGNDIMRLLLRCEVFENVYDLVNRLMRAVGYSIIEQYDRDASERLLGKLDDYIYL